MQGGKAAAETAISMQVTGDYSAASTSQYEQKWNHLYGYDFGKVSIESYAIAVAAPKSKASQTARYLKYGKQHEHMYVFVAA